MAGERLLETPGEKKAKKKKSRLGSNGQRKRRKEGGERHVCNDASDKGMALIF